MKYICNFGIDNCDEEREYALSAKDKALFLLNIIAGFNYNIDIISPTVTLRKRFFKKRLDQINERIKVISGPTIPFMLFFNNRISKIFSNIWMMLYLIFHCKKNEVIYVYHLFNLMPFVTLAKKIKKLKVCIEVEEIYSLLHQSSKRRLKKEISFLNDCEFLILASNELRNIIKVDDKNVLVYSGKFEPCEKLINDKQDYPIKVVYSGLIDKKGMANTALSVCKYLNKSFEVHFAGYGTSDDIEDFKADIENNNLTNECKAYYDGMFRGEEYCRYLQQNHIGLCPLNDDNTFQMACFPSKISSYLSNGLFVVTSENKTVRNSVVGDLIDYSKNNDAKNLANTIMNIDIHKSSNIECILYVYDSFRMEVEKFLSEVEDGNET